MTSNNTTQLTTKAYNEIWFNVYDNDKKVEEGFQIPYNPESFRLNEGTNEKSIDLAGGNSIVVSNGSTPAVLTFNSFFPLNLEPGCELADPTQLKKPMEYDALIRKWKNDGKKIHVVITNTNINAHFSVSSYTAEEVGGEVGKIQYTITLKQYGSSGMGDGSADDPDNLGGGLVRRIDIDTSNLPEVPDTYYVQKKDTLQKIAQYFYNDVEMVFEIYKLNSKLLKKGVNTKLKKKWLLYLPRPK